MDSPPFGAAKVALEGSLVQVLCALEEAGKPLGSAGPRLWPRPLTGAVRFGRSIREFERGGEGRQVAPCECPASQKVPSFGVNVGPEGPMRTSENLANHEDSDSHGSL